MRAVPVLMLVLLLFVEAFTLTVDAAPDRYGTCPSAVQGTDSYANDRATGPDWDPREE